MGLITISSKQKLLSWQGREGMNQLIDGQVNESKLLNEQIYNLKN